VSAGEGAQQTLRASETARRLRMLDVSAVGVAPVFDEQHSIWVQVRGVGRVRAVKVNG